MSRTSRKHQRVHVTEYLLAGFLVCMIGVMVWAVFGIARKEEIARKAMNARKAELAVLEERKAVFEENMHELSTDRGQEATLRQNHGVAKAGEEVIIVVPPKEKVDEPTIPWYTRLLGWFGVW